MEQAGWKPANRLFVLNIKVCDGTSKLEARGPLVRLE
jgi:hypothetical protein